MRFMRRISYCYLLILCAENITPLIKHDVSCKPHAVWFQNGDTLNVKIELRNVPKDAKMYHNVILHDGHKKLGIIDISMDEQTIKLKKNLADTWKNMTIRVCLPFIKNSDCEGVWDWYVDAIVLHYPAKLEHRDCIGRQCILTIDWRKNCVNATNNNLKSRPDPAATGNPIITVSHEDDYFVKISCSILAMKYDLLFLFQNQGEEPPLLLKMDQHLLNIRGEMVLTMNKTLQSSDKNHAVYCVKQSIDNYSKEEKSNEIPVLEGDDYDFFETFEPAKVTVEPSHAWFDPDSTLSFVCSGTQPVEGRKLTWYTQDYSNMNSTEVEIPDGQHYDPETVQNNLTLHLNESFHLKTLFCAEDFHFIIMYPNRSSQIKRYSVRDTSEVITLRLREEKKVWPLILTLGLGIAAVLLLAALFVVRARRRRSKNVVVVNEPNEANVDNYCACSNENYYVTPQVTYAVLDLPEATGKATPGQNKVPTENSSYVKIVGFYNPKN